MHIFAKDEYLTAVKLNDNFQECVRIKDTIEMYQSMLKILYNRKGLTDLERLRVKEIEFILSYLQAGEIADEFQKRKTNKN